MKNQVADTSGLMEEINDILKAAEENDIDVIYDHRASILSMYAQAMVEFHFYEHQLEWLNDLLESVEDNDIVQCRKLLEQPTDTDQIFLGSQFVSIMAGCFHHDELLTVAQAVGLKTLLEVVEQSNTVTTN